MESSIGGLLAFFGDPRTALVLGLVNAIFIFAQPFFRKDHPVFRYIFFTIAIALFAASFSSYMAGTSKEAIDKTNHQSEIHSIQSKLDDSNSKLSMIANCYDTKADQNTCTFLSRLITRPNPLAPRPVNTLRNTGGLSLAAQISLVADKAATAASELQSLSIQKEREWEIQDKEHRESIEQRLVNSGTPAGMAHQTAFSHTGMSADADHRARIGIAGDLLKQYSPQIQTIFVESRELLSAPYPVLDKLQSEAASGCSTQSTSVGGCVKVLNDLASTVRSLGTE
jgi:hypothetical protein